MANRIHRVDKPEGWTSHDVVARLRSIRKERRMGHAGTLDPFATGLLLVAEGRATGLLGCLGGLPKRYRARAKLGFTSDTQDRTGTVAATGAPLPNAAEIERALDRFRGPQRQRPPLYSAVKIGGERLYHAARRGEDVERPERSVHVYELTLREVALPEIEFETAVSRGTYVRALAHDLGHALGCGAHLVALRRTAIGPFRVEAALSPDAASGLGPDDFEAASLAPADAIPFLPRVLLTEAEAGRLRNGIPPLLDPARLRPAPESVPPPPGGDGAWPLALLAPDGSLLALARPPEPGAGGRKAALLRVLEAA